MTFSFNSPYQPAVDPAIPVGSAKGQHIGLCSPFKSSNISPGHVGVKDSPGSPNIVSPLPSFVRPFLSFNPQEQNPRRGNGLLPAIQFSSGTPPPGVFSADNATFPFRTSSESRNDRGAFTPLPPHLPLPCTRSADPETANRALGRHMRAYLPRVQEANRALQVALKTRPKDVFQEPLQPVLPMFMPLWNKIQAATGASASAVASNPRLSHLMGDCANTINRKPTDHPKINVAQEPGSGRKCYGGLKRARNLEGYWQTADIRDQLLRQSLLWHAAQPYGHQTKADLLSLTFHDLTPDPRTGAFRNELIAHFEAESPQDGNGETELMLLEFHAPPASSLMQQQVNADGPQPHQGLQRWVLFLILSPLVTFSKSAISAVTNSIGSDARLGPPDLPLPAPQSWLMFATPVENITAHPATKDILASHTLASRSFSPCVSSNATQLRTVLRHDFDFSRDFSPIFKFSPNLGRNAWVASDLCMEELQGEFLSARGMRAFNAATDTIAPPIAEGSASPAASESSNTTEDLDYCEECNEELRAMIAQRKAERKAYEQKEKRDKQLKEAMARNTWWHETRDTFTADAKTWQRIREAMARGCCRVVAREVADPERSGIDAAPPENGAKGDNVPQRISLKRGCSTHRSGKGSALCRGLDRGHGPSSLSEMELSEGDGVSWPGLEMETDGMLSGGQA